MFIRRLKPDSFCFFLEEYSVQERFFLSSFNVSSCTLSTIERSEQNVIIDWLLGFIDASLAFLKLQHESQPDLRLRPCSLWCSKTQMKGSFIVILSSCFHELILWSHSEILMNWWRGGGKTIWVQFHGAAQGCWFQRLHLYFFLGWCCSTLWCWECWVMMMSQRSGNLKESLIDLIFPSEVNLGTLTGYYWVSSQTRRCSAGCHRLLPWTDSLLCVCDSA